MTATPCQCGVIGFCAILCADKAQAPQSDAPPVPHVVPGAQFLYPDRDSCIAGIEAYEAAGVAMRIVPKKGTQVAVSVICTDVHPKAKLLAKTG